MHHPLKTLFCLPKAYKNPFKEIFNRCVQRVAGYNGGCVLGWVLRGGRFIGAMPLVVEIVEKVEV